MPSAMRTRYFTGREDLLARLRQHLVERHAAALSGLGGVGKTQTAMEYAVRHRSDYPNGVFWINAETLGGLTSGFIEMAATLRLPAAESSDNDAAVKAVLAWLNGTPDWLLILDNVDNRGDIQRFVPEQGQGDLLITSRESVFAELGIPRALEVLDLDADEAVRFLLARTGRESTTAAESADALELAAELGHLPLALEQAAAYVAEANATFSSYLRALRTRRETLLEKAAGLIARDTVAITWVANFEAVERASPAAAAVLRMSALLAPDAIPFELFLDGAQVLGNSIEEALADADDLAMAALLRPLSRYSLVRTDTESLVFSMHRLVQQSVVGALEEPERRTYLEMAVRALDIAFPKVEYANWVQSERLVAHVTSIARWLDTHDVQPEMGSSVLNRTAHYLRERGRYREAQTLSERALTIGERALGPVHPTIALSLNNLAYAHWAQGRYAEALSLHERALAIRVRALGPDHLDVAASLHNLAIVHWDQGRYAEALMMGERALAIRERALGPDHPDVGKSLNNLAIVHRDTGRYAEALALGERALAIRENAFGSQHPDVSASLHNLGICHMDQGRYTEALALGERALAIRERALGPDHPDVAHTLNYVADVLLECDRPAEALALYDRALVIEENALGADHPTMAQTLNGIANAYLHLGRHADAEPLYMRALEIRERALGHEHAWVAETLVGLAKLRQEMGRDGEALALYERALSIKERTLVGDTLQLREIRAAIDALR